MNYLVFAGDIYYPGRGAKDLVAWSDDYEEATKRALEFKNAKGGSCDWAQVLDTRTLQIENYDRPYSDE